MKQRLISFVLCKLESYIELYCVLISFKEVLNLRDVRFIDNFGNNFTFSNIQLICNPFKLLYTIPWFSESYELQFLKGLWPHQIGLNTINRYFLYNEEQHSNLMQSRFQRQAVLWIPRNWGFPKFKQSSQICLFFCLFSLVYGNLPILPNFVKIENPLKVLKFKFSNFISFWNTLTLS